MHGPRSDLSPRRLDKCCRAEEKSQTQAGKTEELAERPQDQQTGMADFTRQTAFRQHIAKSFVHDQITALSFHLRRHGEQIPRRVNCPGWAIGIDHHHITTIRRQFR